MEHKCNQFESVGKEDNKQKEIGEFVVPSDSHEEEGVDYDLCNE